MNTKRFVRRTALPVDCDAAFRYHERPGAIQRMIPPWEKVRVGRHDGIHDGARAELVNYLGPLPLKWVVEHRDYVPGRQFRDVQLSGPFAYWNHLHRFEPLDAGVCLLEDSIEYALPAGAWGAALGGSTVESKLHQMFSYRHQRAVADLHAHAKYKDRGTMKIAITGASGLVGSDLCAFLTTGGHDVLRLVRGEVKQPEQEIHWKPSQGVLPAEDLEGLDAVIHLGGESIAEGRWSDAKKQRIRDSRVDSTRLLAETLAQLQNPPRTFICASAIGFYGDRGDEVLTEESAAGKGFLPEVCQQWEAACEAARDSGIRVVQARFGMILSPQGGALAKMLTPFKLGGGGVIGGGRQYWSWVSLDDVVQTLHFALMNDQVAGPINVTAPHPVTNTEFTKTLGRVLSRPTILPMPAFAARLALGEMADALILCSARVLPAALEEAGYEFLDPKLEPALRKMLGR